MCGRYLIVMEDDILEMREILDEINERYKDTPDAAATKVGEVCPTDTAPVLVRGDEKPRSVLMKWGFPKPSGGQPTGRSSGVIINARAETAPNKPMFRPSLVSRRCVVPTTGFFEWRQEDGKKKTKYLFRLPDTKVLYLAGLYGAFRDGVGRSFYAYVILTSAANSSVEPYHNRMPLILLPADIHSWLTDASFALGYTQRPCPVMLGASAVK